MIEAEEGKKNARKPPKFFGDHNQLDRGICITKLARFTGEIGDVFAQEPFFALIATAKERKGIKEQII